MSSQLGSFEKILRVGEGRRMKRLAEQAAYITSIEPEFRELSDDQLRDKTVEFRARLENGEELEELLFEAFAEVREARLRESDQRMFDVQLMGGIVLHEGDVEHDPTHQLNVEHALVGLPQAGLPDLREGLEEKLLELLSVLEPRPELDRLVP